MPTRPGMTVRPWRSMTAVLGLAEVSLEMLVILPSSMRMDWSSRGGAPVADVSEENVRGADFDVSGYGGCQRGRGLRVEGGEGRVKGKDRRGWDTKGHGGISGGLSLPEIRRPARGKRGGRLAKMIHESWTKKRNGSLLRLPVQSDASIRPWVCGGQLLRSRASRYRRARAKLAQEPGSQ